MGKGVNTSSCHRINQLNTLCGFIAQEYAFTLNFRALLYSAVHGCTQTCREAVAPPHSMGAQEPDINLRVVGAETSNVRSSSFSSL